MSLPWRGDAGFVSAALLVGAITLAPVWLSPVLATNDGPSHVYNAVLAAGVAAGRPPYATYFQLEHGLRPDAATHALLVFLGPRLGWDTAERLVVTLAMVSSLAVLLSLLHTRDPTLAGLLAPLAAWLATNWFVWVGLYDFALSIPCYAALLLILDRPFSLRSHLALQLALALLYITHFFTFAVGIALVAGVLGWRVLMGQGPWAALRVVLPALALLTIETASGGPGAGSLHWPEDHWAQVRGLLMGDFVVSARMIDAVAGAIIALAVTFTAVWRVRAASREGWRTLTGAELFGATLIVLSLLAPDGVGEGSYIPIRMRFLGTLAVLPAVADGARRMGAVRLAALAVLLSAALAWHSAALMGNAKRSHRDLVLIDSLFTAAGTTEGAWVVRRFTVYPRGRFLNLIERVAVRRGLVVLDNYEARYGIFPTAWRHRPDWVTFQPSRVGLAMRLVLGTVPWPGGVYVLHERDRSLQVADPRLELGTSVTGGAFAVTLVRRWR